MSMSLPNPMQYDLGRLAELDPALRTWLVEWQQREVSGQSESSGEAAKLEVVLGQSPLDAVAMLKLAHTFHAASDDTELTVRFYEAASQRVDHELNDPQTSPGAALDVVKALDLYFKDYTPLFWDNIEGHGNWESARTLYRLCDNFIRHIPAGNDALKNDSKHAQICAAECLYVFERYDDALRLLASLPTTPLTNSERASYNWTKGMVLMHTGDFASAIPPLRELSRNKSSQHSIFAEQFLIEALCKTGNVDDAEDEFRRYSSRVPANSSGLRSCREEIEAARRRPSE